MENYVCAILLLMCGLVHFATQVQGSCTYGGETFSVGTHVRRQPCLQLTCYANDEMNVFTCPTNCIGGNLYVVYVDPPNPNEEYPGCCPEFHCIEYPNARFEYIKSMQKGTPEVLL